MSQSPLARSSRRSLHPFAHPPSRLSRSHGPDDQLETGSTPSSSSPNAFAASQSPATTPPSTASYATPTREARFRSAGVGSPSTPKILYSPYALSTPPAALSRSSSIPFDMAASARAARQAVRPLDDAAVSVAKKKRFIRKKPLWTKMTEAPRNFLDNASFHIPSSIEDLLPSAHLANPIALGIQAFHYLLLAPLFKTHAEPQSVLRSSSRSHVDSRWDRFEQEAKVRSGALSGNSALLVTALLLALAVANSVYLFTRFKTYDMQLRSAHDPVHSPHASPVAAPRVQPVQLEPEDQKVDTLPAKVLRYAGIVVALLAKWAYAAVWSAFGRSIPSSGTFGGRDQIQSLRVWEPPEFCLAFFCAYPLSAPLLSYLLTTRHPFLTPVLHIVTTFLLSHLATSFAQLVKDRMLLAAEVMKEYDQRFVYKRVFGARVDRGVGTHEAETVW